MHKGSCLCKAIEFQVEGSLPQPSACHCTKCRKHTGHFEAGIDIPKTRVSIQGSEKLSWYESSEKARRGFCSICGSSLFFEPLKGDWIGISMGAFDGPTNVKLALHIFVGDKGDYYDIADGVPQYALYPGAEKNS